MTTFMRRPPKPPKQFWLNDEQVGMILGMMQRPKGLFCYPPSSVKWGINAATRMVALEIIEILEKADKFTAPQDIAEEIRKRI